MFFVRVRKNKLFIGKIGNVSPDLCEFDNNFLLTNKSLDYYTKNTYCYCVNSGDVSIVQAWAAKLLSIRNKLQNPSS